MSIQNYTESKTIRLGTRPSRLALKQVKEIRGLMPECIDFEIMPIKTTGDIDKITPLIDLEGSDFFTREIEKALMDNKIDAAIHSAKDLEEEQPWELAIPAMTKSASIFECLVSKDNLKLDELPLNAIIGTSSKKRKQAINRYRADLIIKDIRGDIDERLKKLDNGEYDAIIVAHIALLRLGHELRISQIIPTDIIQPHPLQGRLAVQVKKQRKDLIDLFKVIDDK